MTIETMETWWYVAKTRESRVQKLIQIVMENLRK